MIFIEKKVMAKTATAFMDAMLTAYPIALVRVICFENVGMNSRLIKQIPAVNLYMYGSVILL